MATIQVRVDDKLKAEADALFSDLGLDTSTAIRAFLKQSIRTGGIPFELRSDPWRAYVERALDEADEEARHPGPRIGRDEFLREMRAYVKELSSESDATV